MTCSRNPFYTYYIDKISRHSDFYESIKIIIILVKVRQKMLLIWIGADFFKFEKDIKINIGLQLPRSKKFMQC